jgi:SAM-dependent methyltransferase
VSERGGSFRDPAGGVRILDGRILRFIRKEYVSHFDAFSVTQTAGTFVSSHRLVASRRLDDQAMTALLNRPEVQKSHGNEIGLIVEHDPIPFPSFPYEWAPPMLYEAGRLTLDLAAAAQTEGFGLKDATPYNVLYQCTKPMFIDATSFERRAPGDPIWLPYAQFVRTFILPLLVSKHFGTPLSQVFTTHRDGLAPEDVYRSCTLLQKLRPPFLSLVTLPVWLASERATDRLLSRRRGGNEEKSAYVLQSLFQHLRRTLRRVAPATVGRSYWSGYMETQHSYSAHEFKAKEEYIAHVLKAHQPRMVLDAGCNTGHFAELAARSGAMVVAIDSDEAAVSQVWKKADHTGLNILPLVVDLARPSPAIGWRNRECPAFLERARGVFQAVLLLATLHHLLIRERIPLSEIIELVSELTTDLAVVEFIEPHDAVFQRLARGREHFFASLTRHQFETFCSRHFQIREVQRIGESARCIYVLRKHVPCVG